MPLFHIFTVKPVRVPQADLPRVQYGDYYVHEPSLAAAWVLIQNINPEAGLVDAWGAQCDESFRITPNVYLSRQDYLSRYSDWMSAQTTYQRLSTHAPQVASDERVDINTWHDLAYTKLFEDKSKMHPADVDAVGRFLRSDFTRPEDNEPVAWRNMFPDGTWSNWYTTFDNQNSYLMHKEMGTRMEFAYPPAAQ